MNYLKYEADYNYKYCTAFNQKTKKEKKVLGNITLWKINNRLSYLRCMNFLDKFFMNVWINNIEVKTRTSKIRNYVRFNFDLEKNWEVFFMLRNKLPEPEIVFLGTQYIISYNFYRFLVEIPIKTTDHYNLQKISQILPPQWRDI